MKVGSMALETHCPHCGVRNEATTGVTDGAMVPDSGSISLCWECLGWAVFIATPFGLSLRQATPAEVAEFEAAKEFQPVLHALREAGRR